ncbi:MAG: hypothetical protein H6909_04070 [Rickettsiaceae bacterium]|nr:hypothetical protein [Rickettsiaceae bacterium]
MPSKFLNQFSKDELFFINLSDDNEKNNADQALKRMTSLLVKNIGNMELNARSYEELEQNTQLTPDQIDQLKLIERWTYKTPTAQEIKSIALKIKYAKALSEQGIELLPEEKISLLELKQISRFSLLLGKKNSFKDPESETAKKNFLGFPGIEPFLQQMYQQCNNQELYENKEFKEFKEFKELYENMVICEELAADLRQNIFKVNTYQAGDILIRDPAKSAVIENVAQRGTKKYLPVTIQIITSDKTTTDAKAKFLVAATQFAESMKNLSANMTGLDSNPSDIKPLPENLTQVTNTRFDTYKSSDEALFSATGHC